MGHLRDTVGDCRQKNGCWHWRKEGYRSRAGLAALSTANPALLRYYLAPVVASLCYEYFDQATNDESGNSYFKNDHGDP